VTHGQLSADLAALKAWARDLATRYGTPLQGRCFEDAAVCRSKPELGPIFFNSVDDKRNIGG
jgi:hypothetical protein